MATGALACIEIPCSAVSIAFEQGLQGKATRRDNQLHVSLRRIGKDIRQAVTSPASKMGAVGCFVGTDTNHSTGAEVALTVHRAAADNRQAMQCVVARVPGCPAVGGVVVTE